MKAICVLPLLFPFVVCAQSLKTDTTKGQANVHLLLDTVVQSNYSKSQLYSNAVSYIANSFKDSRAVVESKDAESGEIIFNGHCAKMFDVTTTDKKGKVKTNQAQATLFFKCKLYLKDNKFKAVLLSLEYPFGGYADTGVNYPLTLPVSNEYSYITGARELAYSLIKDIAAKINSKPENDF